jgi:hypothetical protein
MPGPTPGPGNVALARYQTVYPPSMT